MFCSNEENFRATRDDFRPVQSSLLTRFAAIDDSSDLWRTSNQDYGSFYYQRTKEIHFADRLKSKNHRRQNRFENWLSSQKKSSNCRKKNDVRSIIFNSNRRETVRLTHRKQFQTLDEQNRNNGENQTVRRKKYFSNEIFLLFSAFQIVDFLVKLILQRLRPLIKDEECRQVTECAEIFVLQILNEQVRILKVSNNFHEF